MQEGSREESPRLGGTEVWHEGQVARHLGRYLLQQPHHRGDNDNDEGDHRTPARGDRGTELRARHTHALLALADAVDALDADRGRPLTFRAGGQAAALAAHIGHPIGVPRTDRLCLVWRGLTHV